MPEAAKKDARDEALGGQESQVAAVQAHKAVAARDPSNKAVQVETIEALLRLGDYTGAHEVAAAALRRFPGSPAISLADVRALLALERKAEASDVLKALCEHRPGLDEAWEKWGIVATLAGRFSDAHLAYKGAAARHPSDCKVWNSLADMALLCGAIDDAEAAWRRSLAINPNQSIPAGQLGRLLMKRGAFEDAALWLERSVASDPALVPAHVNLATVYLRLKRRAEALHAAEQAVLRGPERPECHTTHGNVLLDMGCNGPAAAAFQRALDREDTNAEALFGLANANARGGNPAGAVAALDRFLALRPDDGQALHMRRVWSQEGARSSPDDYVRRLFDSVADGFERHLQVNLSYNAPEQAAALLASCNPRRDRFRVVCDVGCGTGLMAKALAPRFAIAEMVGIDLAPKMLEQARAKALYSELIAGEAVTTLAAMTRSFDLITAMDVLIYIGEGGPFLREAAHHLAPGGMLVLSLEVADDVAELRLEPTTRFSHNKAHFVGLAARHGLACVKDADVALRRESNADVRGSILIFERR